MRAAHYRRNRKRRVLIALNVVLAMMLINGGAVIGYAKWRFNQINKVGLDNVLAEDDGPMSPMTVLLVGSDSRMDLPRSEARQLGGADATPGLSDTMMLVRVDPTTRQAAVLSLPRDTWVRIAGKNGHDKLNSAFMGGGVDGITRLIKTINENLHIEIDHYVQVDFGGFKGVVDTIGGVQVPFDAPVRDWGYDEATHSERNLSGLDIRQTGCVNLNGNEALSYTRSRHYQMLERGRWIADPQGDLTRIQRQQDFVRRVMHKAADEAKGNPLQLNSLLATGVKNVTIDDALSLGDITKLARRFESMDPASVQMMTLPTHGRMISGAAAEVIEEPQAQNVIDQFLNRAPVAPPESTSTTSPSTTQSTTTTSTTTPQSRFTPDPAMAC